MAPHKKNRGVRTSALQQSAMLTFLESNQGLVKRKSGIHYGKEMARKKWLQLTYELNKIPGAVKTPAQWQTVWRDMKSKTGIKFRNLKGEGPWNRIITEGLLTQIEERIVAIAGWEDGFENEEWNENYEINEINESNLLDENEILPTGSIDENLHSILKYETENETMDSNSFENYGTEESAELHTQQHEEYVKPPKRSKLEVDVKDDFLQIAKRQADAMLMLANAQKDTAKALLKISDGIALLGEIVTTQKRIENKLSELEKSIETNHEHVT
ncbi:uncharacterized protein LOC142241763 [Haematobia irritans]|uniref:uncharacterized protein LOC142241763 n=1 Tax=Haematobia irritans TaxID=7368 RepID=UPI003F4FA33D